MKAIRVKEEWQKALVYYIRYEFIKNEIKINPERINFFTPEWEFKSDSLNDKYILVLDDYNNPVSTIRFLIDSNNYGLIERVRTIPKEERKGYGSFAMEEGEKWLKDLGVNKVFVEAIPNAFSFYEKIGYEFSSDRNILRNHNDLLLMEKNI